MNQTLQKFARLYIKDGLNRCTDKEVSLFKRMYAKNQETPKDKVVDDMPEEKLDWAMQQIDRTLEKRSEKEEPTLKFICNGCYHVQDFSTCEACSKCTYNYESQWRDNEKNKM